MQFTLKNPAQEKNKNHELPRFEGKKYFASGLAGKPGLSIQPIKKSLTYVKLFLFADRTGLAFQYFVGTKSLNLTLLKERLNRYKSGCHNMLTKIRNY